MTSSSADEESSSLQSEQPVRRSDVHNEQIMELVSESESNSLSEPTEHSLRIEEEHKGDSKK